MRPISVRRPGSFAGLSDVDQPQEVVRLQARPDLTPIGLPTPRRNSTWAPVRPGAVADPQQVGRAVVPVAGQLSTRVSASS